MTPRPYAEVIGDPIAHSKSPLIHNFWLQKLGVDAEYRATHVRADELEDYFAQRREDPNWRGCNVTMPHKHAALSHIDEPDELADDTAATNCIVNDRGGLAATNTDVWGILATLGLFEAKDPIVVIGAGGAARAALKVLDQLQACDVHIVARDVKKAETLLESFEMSGAAWRLGDKLNIQFTMLLINASPLGMAQAPAMPEEVLRLLDRMDDQARVFDMIYQPLETPLLRAARQRGLQAANGLPMLVDQARESFAHFFEQRPSHDLDDALFNLLTA